MCHQCGYPGAPSETACPKDGNWLVDAAVHDKHPNDPFLGKIIADKYPLVGILGAGGMGSVYRGIQQPVGREVAVKVIRYTGDDAETVRQRFAHEASIVAKLSHPNTVTLFDFGVHGDGTLYMVLELVEGHPLSQEISAGPLPVDRACSIIGAALDALIEAHKAGLVHRDLKPDNIMLAPTTWGGDTVKVLDFGIAKALGGDESATSQLTQTGMVFGTPRYMAPEQARAKAIDHRADLYAMGVLLYECVSGRVPFDADNTFDILLAQLQMAPPDIDDPSVPKEVKDILAKALAKKPEDRYQSAVEMCAAVREAGGLAARSSEDGEPATAAGEASLGTPFSSNPIHRSTPVGGTSQMLSAEMVVQRAAPPETSRRGWAVAGVAAVALAAGIAALTVSPEDGDSTVESVAASATPGVDRRKVANRLLGEGLRAGKAGDAERAKIKLQKAVGADPSFAEPHLHLAGLHAKASDAFKAIGALEAYLGVNASDEAVEARIASDPDFEGLLGDKTFQGWLRRRGLRGGPPAWLAPTPKASPKRRKRRKAAGGRALEVPEF